MLEHSPSLGALSEALSKYQFEIRTATKNAVNPHFRSKYANLEEIIDCVRPVLGKYDLTFTQHPSYVEGTVSLTSFLTHVSGEWIKSTCSSPIPKLDVQGVGSAITYLRRYSLQSIFMFASQDDDGNSVSVLTEVVPSVNTKPTENTKPKITIG